MYGEDLQSVDSNASAETAGIPMVKTNFKLLAIEKKNEKHVDGRPTGHFISFSNIPTDRFGLFSEVRCILSSLINCEKFNWIMPVPSLQKPAPVFTGTAVVDGQFEEISLDKYKGKYVVLFFYPLDFTFVCPTEIIAFSDRIDEFKKIDTVVIGASTDSHFSHLAWINTPRKQGGLGPMNIPLLADKNTKISKEYGVYDEESGVTFRGLFIIDRKGTLRQITINDLPVGRSVDETLRLVQAFQFTDEHGEVCPAGWTPGKKTMKPDPKESKTYFDAVNK